MSTLPAVTRAAQRKPALRAHSLPNAASHPLQSGADTEPHNPSSHNPPEAALRGQVWVTTFPPGTKTAPELGEGCDSSTLGWGWCCW